MAFVKWRENGYLKKQMGKYALLLIFISVTGLIFFESSFVRHLPWYVFLLVVPSLFYVHVRVYLSLFKTSRNYEQGLEGEADVAKELCKLPEGYFGFHDVKLDTMHGNIDFVVVTPTHVYTLEVKNTRWPFTRFAVGQAKKEAKLLNQWIMSETGQNVFVQPVVVFAHSMVRLHNGVHDGAGVVGLSGMNDFIADKSGKLHDTGKVVRVVQALKRFTPVHEVVCE